MEKENLAITEASCPLALAPLQEERKWSETRWVNVHWVSTYCVSSPEAGTVGKEKLLAFLVHAFFYCKGFHTSAFSLSGEAETEEVKGEKLLLCFLLKCSWHIFLWAGGGKNLQLDSLSKNIPGAHRWVSGFQVATPALNHMTCPPWTGLKWALAMAQVTRVWLVGTGGYLALTFLIALALSLIAMAAAGSSPASTPSSLGFPPSPSLQNGHPGTSKGPAFNPLVVTHYSWHKSHFLEWLTTSHMAGLYPPLLPPLTISVLQFLRPSHLGLHLVLGPLLLPFSTFGSLLMLLLPPSPPHSSLTSFQCLSLTCLSFRSQLGDLLRHLELGQFPVLTPPMTHINPHSQHSSYSVVFSC